METFVLDSRLWDDPEFCQLSDLGQMTFLKLARLMDGNWGHVCARTLRQIVVLLYPDEAETAAYGDPTGQQRMAEVLDQLTLAIELGLLITDETRDGIALGYHNWELHTGAGRRRRGKPEHAMGPNIAAHRDWSRVHPNSRDGAQRWAKRLGIDGICCAWSTVADVTLDQEHDIRGQLWTKRTTYDGNGGPCRGPGAGGRGPGAGSRGPGANAHEAGPASQAPDEPPPPNAGAEELSPNSADPARREPPPGVLEAFSDIGRSLPAACSQPEAERLTALALESAFRAARERDAYHERPGALYDRKLRDGDEPEVRFTRQARRLWAPPRATATTTAPDEPERQPVVMWRCPRGRGGVGQCAFQVRSAAPGEQLEVTCIVCGSKLEADEKPDPKAREPDAVAVGT